jgi:hypothetical protein
MDDVEIGKNDASLSVAPQPPTKARLTYWGNVSYQYPDPAREPVTVEIRHSQEVDSQEQVYVRYTTADLSWREVDTGWVTSASLLIVKNTEPASSNKNLMVSFSRREEGEAGDLLLPPGEALVYQPVHRELYVTGGGAIAYSVTAIPL